MIHYRDAEPHEGATLGGIARATFIETFGHLYNLKDLASFLEKGSDAACAAELSNPAVEVRFACAGSTPIGFAKLSGITLPVEPSGPAIELRQLYIFKPWHGQGIAEALMDWATPAPPPAVHRKSGSRSGPKTTAPDASMPARASPKSAPMPSWSASRPMKTYCAGRS